MELLATVTLLEDHAELGLKQGQVGTVVEALAPGVVEVEFSDNEGRTIVTAALAQDKLLALRREAVGLSDG